MASDLFSGHSFHAVRWACETRPEVRGRGLSLLAGHLAWILLVAVALAHANPPDPSWIPGICDGRDADDVVVMVTDATGVTISRGTHRVDRVLAGSVPGSATRGTSTLSMLRHPIRGPPVLTEPEVAHRPARRPDLWARILARGSPGSCCERPR